MKIKAVTISDDTVSSSFAPNLKRMTDYLSEEGIDFEVIKETSDPDISVYIHKTIEILRLAEDKTNEILIWMDGDIAPVNRGFRDAIVDMFRRPINAVFACGERGISAGFFAVRNNSWSIEFLNTWKDLCLSVGVKAPSWDEALLLSLVNSRLDLLQRILLDSHVLIENSITNTRSMLRHIGGMPLNSKTIMLNQATQPTDKPPTSYSQYGEDLIVAKEFGDFRGRFLEIGASNGIKDSNTRLLLELGWTGVQIEPNPHLFVELLKNSLGFHATQICAAVGGEMQLRTLHLNIDGLSTTHPVVFANMESNGVRYYGSCFTPTITIEEVTKAFGHHFDFVSVDAEGMDYDIISNGINHIEGARIICVETDVPGTNGTHESESRWHDLMHENGYKILRKTEGNLIYESANRQSSLEH